MPEATKTVIFVVLAVAVTAAAIFVYPKQENYVAPDRVAKPLFEGFTKPEEAAELSIVKFKEDVGQFSRFSVARSSATGLWTIPSSANYPADAEAQMRDAATSLIDLRVLDVASDQSADHAMFGVIEPDENKMDVGQKGVGLLVKVKDSRGKNLADLVIGKRVKGSDDQRFVRIPGQDLVYVVSIDPDKFPTEFKEWIEQDLLKLKPLDIETVELKDYSLLNVGGNAYNLQNRFDAEVRWDDESSRWVLVQLADYRGREPKPTELLPTEELDDDKLDDLKTALGGLRIVGVVPKPPGLGANLEASEDFLNNHAALNSLVKSGFVPIQGESGESPIRSANGEVFIGTKKGVEYVLRFGEIESIASADDGETGEGELNRYLLVAARIDESKFPPLELEPEPDPASFQSNDPAAKQDSIEVQSALEKERERISKDNQRKKDAREEALKIANAEVESLNGRFGDWYYVIAESEYKRIHLNRNDLIKEKATAADEGFGIDSLRKLEQEGIEKNVTPANSHPLTAPVGPSPGL